jgi:hypothetical protein
MAGQDIPTNSGAKYADSVIDATAQWPTKEPTPPPYTMPLTLNGTMACSEVSPLRQKHDALRAGLEGLLANWGDSSAAYLTICDLLEETR